MKTNYGDYVIKKIKEAKIDKIILLTSLKEETIETIYYDILTIRFRFVGTNLKNKIKLWRREILRSVLGDKTISINDERVSDFKKYEAAILNKDIVVFIGENINNCYDKKILGIVGKGLDYEKAFFPSDSEVFQKSNDSKEEFIFAQSQPQ